jgi:hypothetical protein
MMLPEPPNTSIVGWGHPIRAAHVRIDDYANADHRDERWFSVDDGLDDEPLSWSSLLRSQRGNGMPYLLVRKELES